MADANFGILNSNMPSTSQNSASSSTGSSGCTFSSISSDRNDSLLFKPANSSFKTSNEKLLQESTHANKTTPEASKNVVNLTGRVMTVDDWVKVPEFIPRNTQNMESIPAFTSLSLGEEKSKKKLCPYAEREGLCKYPPGECTYLHGEVCDFCTKPALHPYNEELRKKHTQECIKQHELNMELAFAVARSKEKVCGICFETILQKTSPEQCFGILPNCNHCFCLACIRRWRQAKQFENKIIRACPECRVTSDFVCPSAYWVDTKEEKEKVIKTYKENLARKDCKYFKQGRGTCPFGNKCFYNHALPDGQKIDVGPPPSLRTTLIEIPHDVELVQRLLLLGYFQEGCPFESIPEELLELVEYSDFSDTDDSALLSDDGEIEMEDWDF